MNEPPFLLADELRYGEPAWRMALLFPPQGSWLEADYLTPDAGRQIEFDCGSVQVLNTPTKEHQRLARIIHNPTR